MRIHWITITAIITASINLGAFADEPAYFLEMAPWSNQNFEICKPAHELNLRPVIFTPQYQSIAFPVQTKPAMTSLSYIPSMTLADGTAKPAHFIEQLIPAEKQISAYQFLENQTIGYLNNNDEWVNKDGNVVRNISDFTHYKGTKTPPKNIPIASWHVPYDIRTPKNKVDMYIEQVKEGPNCRYYSYGYYETEFTQYYVISGNNNAYSCDIHGGFKKNQNLNYTKTQKRRIVSRPDTSRIYLKDREGKFRVIGSMLGSFEKFTKKSDQSTCDWKPIQTD